jgi:hypothetical protein
VALATSPASLCQPASARTPCACACACLCGVSYEQALVNDLDLLVTVNGLPCAPASRDTVNPYELVILSGLQPGDRLAFTVQGTRVRLRVPPSLLPSCLLVNQASHLAKQLCSQQYFAVCPHSEAPRLALSVAPSTAPARPTLRSSCAGGARPGAGAGLAAAAALGAGGHGSLWGRSCQQPGPELHAPAAPPVR